MISQKTDFDSNEQGIDLAQLEEKLNLTKPSSEKSANKEKRQPIRHLLIGSPQLVKSTIHYLHLVNYAEVGDWSRFLASPNNPEEVMSMLVRYLKVQQ